MSSSKVKQRTEGNFSVLTFPKSTKPAFEQVSLPSVVGYNLSEFSLSPLGQRTQHLANGIVRHEWTQKLDGGGERLCFFEKSYGSVAPNSDTEDVLLILNHLANQSDDPLSVKTSIYEILKLQGNKHRPNRQQIQQVVRHLDALYGMSLRTNFVYNREKKNWETVRTRVLAAYAYKDEAGRVRKRRVRIKRGEGDHEQVEIIVEQRVKELSEVNFTPIFYRCFIKDSVPIDLGVYFGLGLPTSKRIYRFGNKYIQIFGHHSLDLQLFCVSRIGMSPDYIEKYKPSILASKIRPHAKRVTESGKMVVMVEKTNSMPSGYKITFDRPTLQLPLPSLASSYTKAEEKAHRLLVDNGIYPNVATALVVKCRNVIGKDAPRYIDFVVRRFKRDWVKSGKLKVPVHKTPGVLKSFFDNNWYYPYFIEWSAEAEKRERREEAARYAHQGLTDVSSLLSQTPHQSVAAQTPTPVLGQTHLFSLDRFKVDYPEPYQRIYEAVDQRYQVEGIEGLDISDLQLAGIKKRAIVFYCEQCFKEFEKGKTDYFPPSLIEE